MVGFEFEYAEASEATDKSAPLLRTGMGNVLPDRLFWAQSDSDPDVDADDDASPPIFDLPAHDTKH